MTNFSTTSEELKLALFIAVSGHLSEKITSFSFLEKVFVL